MKVTETIIVVFYFLVCIGIGVYFNRRSNTDMSEYYTAGGRINLPISVLAAFSAFASGGTILGGSGFSYNFGVAYTWACNIGSIVGFTLAAVLIAPYLRQMKLNTVVDFFKERYNWKPISLTCGFIILIVFSAYLVSQFKGAAITGQYLFGWGYTATLLFVALIYILYVSLGGMWAVTMTDAVQATLMLIASVGLAIVCIVNFGGIGPLLQQAIAVKPEFASNSLPAVSLVGFCLLWVFSACCLPHIVMRILSSENTRVAKQTFGWCGLLYGLFSMCFVAIAGAALVLFPPGTANALPDSDLAFIKVMEAYFPPLLQGLAAAAIMAAIMSTTDALLLTISAAVSNDILPNLKPSLSEKTLLRAGAVSVWIFGALTALLAINPPELLSLLYANAVGLLTTGFFWPLVFGIWWKKANKYGAMCSLIFGSGLYFVIAVLKMFAGLTLPLFADFVICITTGLAGTVIGILATQRKQGASDIMDPVHRDANVTV